MREKTIVSFDGHKIHCYIWDNVENPKGVVQIIHGIAENALRYKDFAEYLNKSGYIVFADDHRAHGKTAGSFENIGKYEGGNVFFDTVQDEKFFSNLIKQKYKLPLFIFGHSYGSFITQCYLENCQLYKSAILSGTACMRNRMDVKTGLFVAKTTAKYRGNDAPAKMIEKFSFGRYNKLFKGNGTWVNSDVQRSKQYYSDPHIAITYSAKFYVDMFSAFKNIYKPINLNKISKSKPILLLSGKEDALGKMGKSVAKLYGLYKEYDLNVSMKLYDGLRHEIINEVENKQVYTDIVNFYEGTYVDSVESAINKRKARKKV